VANGVNVNWLGFNAAYLPAPIGGAISLRFGPATTRYSGTDALIGLGFVKQAFASFKPDTLTHGKVTLDFGKFDGPYGAEVADSQYNANYTRSVLNYFGQPFFFTGFRATVAFTENIELKLLAVNGWNNSVDNNRGKTFGGVFTVRPTETLSLALGYIAGPEQSDSTTSTCPAGQVFDRSTAACAQMAGAPGETVLVDDDGANERWRHFIDAIVDWAPLRPLRLVANFDYGLERVPGSTVRWYGLDAVARLRLSDLFATAFRGEGYWDPQGFTLGTNQETEVYTGTLTFLLTPAKHVAFYIDNRMDYASQRVFRQSVSGQAKTQATTTLGIVVFTGDHAGL
jgi:hypothetical protein